MLVLVRCLFLFPPLLSWDNPSLGLSEMKFEIKSKSYLENHGLDRKKKGLNLGEMKFKTKLKSY